MIQLKLVSIKDTLLGHITVPDYFAEWLKKSDYVRQPYIRQPFEIKSPISYHPDAQISVITIAKAHFSQYPKAVYLAEGSIEELEKLKDFSFSPSYYYIRSVLKGE